MNEPSVFTKIINGEIPANKIYEDDLTIAFLPVHPIALGEILVVPKKQVDQFFDLPDVDYMALMKTVKKVAKRMKDVIGPERIGLKIEGLEVPHTHIHVVAFNNIEQFHQSDDQAPSMSSEELKEFAQKLAF